MLFLKTHENKLHASLTHKHTLCAEGRARVYSSVCVCVRACVCVSIAFRVNYKRGDGRVFFLIFFFFLRTR